MLIKLKYNTVKTNPKSSIIYNISKNGKIYQCTYFRLRFMSCEKNILGIISPKKILKSSINRNYARRIIRNSYIQCLNNFAEEYNIGTVFIIQDIKIINQEYLSIYEEIKNAFKDFALCQKSQQV